MKRNGKPNQVNTGEQQLKEIFKKARENYIPSDVRGFAEVVNRYWGIEKLYSRNKIWTLEKPDGVIHPKDIHYLAPFTPYTEKQLKAILANAASASLNANNQEISQKTGDEVKTNKLDIVEEIKKVLKENQFSSEDLAKYAYIQKSRMNRIIHRDIEPTFNDILKLCACRQFRKSDGSRYDLTEFFTDPELKENLT